MAKETASSENPRSTDCDNPRAPTIPATGAGSVAGQFPLSREQGYWKWVPQAFSALRHRNYRLYWLGQVLSLTGTWMQRTAQGWLVTELVLEFASPSAVPALTSWYVGLVTAMSTLPVLFLSGFLGTIADIVNRRRLLIMTQLLLALQAFILAIFAYTGIINIPILIVLSLFLGIVTATDIPARQGLVVHMVGKDDLPNAIAINSGVFNGARVFGPAITGAMLAMKLTVADAFLANAISYVPVIFALYLMRGRFQPEALGIGEKESTLKRMSAGAKYLATTVGLRRITLMVAIASLLASPFMALLPAFARYRLFANAAQFGFLYTCFGIGAVIGAITLATLSAGKVHYFTLRVGYAFLLGSIIAFSLTTTLLLAYFILAMAGFGFTMAFASTNSIIQSRVPDHLRGRVMGTYSQLFVGFYPIGTLFIGWLGSKIGIHLAILAGGVLSSIFALVLLSGFLNSDPGKNLPSSP